MSSTVWIGARTTPILFEDNVVIYDTVILVAEQSAVGFEVFVVVENCFDCGCDRNREDQTDRAPDRAPEHQSDGHIRMDRRECNVLAASSVQVDSLLRQAWLRRRLFWFMSEQLTLQNHAKLTCKPGSQASLISR
jgi:hypothetical protein